MRSTALTDDDLVSGEDVFVAATGVTSGALLLGVRTSAAGVEINFVMRSARDSAARRGLPSIGEADEIAGER